MKPKKAVFVIGVQDRKSGERLTVEVPARSVHEAEAKASDAGWLVLDPTTEPAAQPTAQEVDAKLKERAVMFGVLKALGIAALAVIGLVILGNIVVFLAAQ